MRRRILLVVTLSLGLALWAHAARPRVASHETDDQVIGDAGAWR